MAKPVVFMFSGQGSQYYHMGKELFHYSPAFKAWMIRLDKSVRNVIGISVLDELYNDKRDKTEVFDHTATTTAAIFMVEYALAQVLIEQGLEPDYLLGASLGELVSFVIAGVIGFEELLASLLQQFEAVRVHCEKGSMIAVIHDFAIFPQIPFLHENSEVAARNFQSHFVLAGRRDRLKRIELYLRQNEIPYQALPITLGFHSSLVDPIESGYKAFFQQKNYVLPDISIISCVTGDPIRSVDAKHLWEVVRRTIEFQKAVQNLEKEHSCRYIDLGPSGTLAAFVKRNLKPGSRSEVFPILTPFGYEVENFKKVFHQRYFALPFSKA